MDWMTGCQKSKVLNKLTTYCKYLYLHYSDGQNEITIQFKSRFDTFRDSIWMSCDSIWTLRFDLTM